MKKSKYFKTTDLYHAVFLNILGKEILWIEDDNGKPVFVFEIVEGEHDVFLRKYWELFVIDSLLLDFIRNLKVFKRKFYYYGSCKR